MLADKSILVTGASSGIGYQTVKHCSSLGATIILTSRNIAKLRMLKEELPSKEKHVIIPSDLLIEQEVNDLAESVPILDGVVLNAGVVKTMPLRYINSDEIDTIFSVNIKSSIVLINRLLKLKKLKRGASVCIISS